MIRVEVPATSANCSIGFDCLGLALNWKAVFLFEPAEKLVITGCPAEFANEDNLVVQAFDHVCQAYGKERPPFHLHAESDVPFARGLGSSSCCTAAGVAAANAWFDLQLSTDRLLELATDLEGHPDNAAPALFGGMTACFTQAANEHEDPAHSRIVHVKFDCADFHCLAIIPPYEVSTPEARKVLPATLPFFDAVEQTGHALIFEYAIQNGDQELLRQSCADHLHEPYRQALIPDYAAVKAMADERKLPFWISGSGPTMLVLSMDDRALEAMEQELHDRLPLLNTRRLRISKEGTKVTHEFLEE